MQGVENPGRREAETRRLDIVIAMKGGQAMKRLTINQIEKFIQTLESTERVNGYSEQQKQHAIACLNNYCRELEYQGRKSVKIKGAINGPENLEHDGRTSH